MPLTERPLCSVCCVGYKHAKYIDDCIRSIWKNSYQNIEIIALDDGSDDGSLEKLKRLQKISPCPFEILEQERTGNVGRNFNRTFSASHGEYILFMAMDDMLFPDSIESKIDIMCTDKNCVFTANTMSFKINQKRLFQNLTPLNYINSYDIDTLLELERTVFHTFYIQNAIFKRDIIKSVHAFNEKMIGDDIVLRTKIFLFLQKHHEYRYLFLQSPGFIYREHSGNAHRDRLRQLNLVFQYHDVFWNSHPLPQIVKQWVLDAISNLVFSDALKIFTFSPKATTYLLDMDIVQALNATVAKENMISAPTARSGA
ncbi:glycosyltransferase [uncultured Desulfovibrio sp.]|uniref:glycosyltransferase family 2 protein n=2 Tax=uncultured Desulfovibrio sp. TaxID=167968 RepID=UPI002711E384|nr:glycosyltransferase [uncultured Desulfovibrio sp.]